MMAVRVGGEYGLFFVAPLGEMQPVTGRREAKSAWHFALRRLVCFGGENSHLFCRKSVWALLLCRNRMASG